MYIVLYEVNKSEGYTQFCYGQEVGINIKQIFRGPRLHITVCKQKSETSSQ